MASSLPFTTSYIASRSGVLEIFTSLTTHRVFRELVKDIVFDSSCINPNTVAKHTDCKDGPALARLFQEQQIKQTNELQKCLVNAFTCLSDVKKVTYKDVSQISCLPGDHNDPV